MQTYVCTSKGANAMQHAENTTPITLNQDEPTKEKLHQYIKDMDEYQARLVLSFIQTLFNLSD